VFVLGALKKSQLLKIRHQNAPFLTFAKEFGTAIGASILSGRQMLPDWVIASRTSI
jgi:hypothetical protein